MARLKLFQLLPASLIALALWLYIREWDGEGHDALQRCCSVASRQIVLAVQGWFPIDKDLWGPNMMEQNLVAGGMVSFLAGQHAPAALMTCVSLGPQHGTRT